MPIMKRFLACLLVLSGCAVAPQIHEKKVPPVAEVSPAHPPREMIVYVPQTDDTAAVWLKWFVKYPDLRMVIAVSPHFQTFLKDLHLKTQFQTLLKAGRLELALQIPNAPILPLLIDSGSAKDATPAGTQLPDPAYAYPDDVTQLIARSKAGFFKQWNFLPHGLVVPYGAASPKLVSLLERLGFNWMIGALEAPATDGPYQSGPLMIWDGTPASPPAPLPQGEGGQRPGEATVVRVWDERQMKERPLDGWVMEIRAKNGMFLLPQDSGVAAAPMNQKTSWKMRTWTGSDWSLWIGQPEKNAAWNALRKTREAVEAYKNSGQASVQRLDLAFEEIYNAQNSNYFASIGNTAQSPALAEDREHEFQATLLGVYRIIGQPPPEDLFNSSAAGLPAAARASSTTVSAESFPDGREHVLIQDAVGDALIPGGPDLESLEVWAATDSITWTVTLATMTPAVIDIYIDLNHQPNAGTPSFLPGRHFVTSPLDAWEYAISLSGPVATLYQTQGMGTYGVAQTFPIVMEGARFQVTIPREMMRGSPKRWGYQVLVMSGTTLSDFIDPLEISQKDLWQDLSSGKRNDIPFVRVRAK